MFLGGLRRGPFEARYRAYPVAFLEKASAEEGDKVILPPSALDTLVSLQIEYPMLFKLDNLATERSTHCGVLEFVAEEGRVYLPFWMMQNLALEEGDIVNVRNVSLPKGTYVKLQPFTSDFLDITNPKAVLERTLRSYSCLTTGLWACFTKQNPFLNCRGRDCFEIQRSPIRNRNQGDAAWSCDFGNRNGLQCRF